MKKIHFLFAAFFALHQVNGQDTNTARPVYHESSPRTTDVVHMNLKVELDWDNAYLNGKATLTLKPHFYDLDSFRLDAQGMEIHKVQVVNQGSKRDLNYAYDGMNLRIATGRTLTRDDEMKVYIEYTSKPNELQVEGGNAISEAKGLYFINPSNHPRGWMRQVWTQGEPESNSAWFPTVDKPNERMTHEIAITVPSSYKTLSNGRLDLQTNNRDGSRTDFWLMDQPHAPYLVMMAVGEFAMETEEWNGIPVNYFVEPEYEAVAKQVYPHTIEMLDLYSDILGVSYPWQKYDQVTVREYVSGAMENTTGVIFGDFMYGDSLSWADGTGEDVVAHEMFHHWFGDYVTCESWANLPLNESFATYGEVLWKEHKYGQDEAEWHAYNDLRSYLYEFNRGKSVDLIRYDHESILGMFDSHSYAKGGRVLLMLRHILGDEAFFEGLRVYLEDNAYTAVEIHNLRLAMEQVSGLDLNWFFNQWFLDNGHPQLQIEHNYNREAGEYTVTVTQTQDLADMPLYRLPVSIDVYTSLGERTYEVVVDQQTQDFTFEVMSKPFLVHFDSDQYLLAEINDSKPTDYLLHQLANGPRMMDRYEALVELINTDAKGVRKDFIVRIGMQDDFRALRLFALNHVEDLDQAGKDRIKENVQALLNDPEPSVRASAYYVWQSEYNEGDASFWANLAQNEASYSTRAAAFAGWKKLDEAAALTFARENAITTRGSLSSALIRTLLADADKFESTSAIEMINNGGPDYQATISLWLPLYVSQLQESERSDVLEAVEEVHEAIAEAKSYYDYGIRIAQRTLNAKMQEDGISSEDKAKYEAQLAVIENM